MKNILNTKSLFLVILLLICVSGTYAQKFRITTDTVGINVKKIIHPVSKARLVKAVKYRDYYFCNITENSLYSSYTSSHLLAISTDGKRMKRVTMPDECNLWLYDNLFVRNDTLFIQPFNHDDEYPTGFAFDYARWLWYEVDYPSNEVYADEDFIVNYRDNAQNTPFVHFINKKTKVDHIFNFSHDRLIKVQGKYYLINNNVIGEIDDPNTGFVMTSKSRKIQDIAAAKKSRPNVVAYAMNRQWRKEQNIPQSKIDTLFDGSFAHNNQLYVMMTDNNDSYISKYEKGKLEKVESFGKRFRSFNFMMNDLGHNISNESALIKFTENPNLWGIIDINKDDIHVLYIQHNLDSLQFLGKDNFNRSLELACGKLNEMTIDDVDAMEKELEGVSNGFTEPIDIQRQTEEGRNPDKYGFRTYFKTINRNITLCNYYCYDKSTRKLTAAVYDWRQTNCYGESEASNAIYKNDAKRAEIIAAINAHTGQEPGFVLGDMVWQHEGNILKLKRGALHLEIRPIPKQ